MQGSLSRSTTYHASAGHRRQQVHGPAGGPEPMGGSEPPPPGKQVVFHLFYLRFVPGGHLAAGSRRAARPGPTRHGKRLVAPVDTGCSWIHPGVTSNLANVATQTAPPGSNLTGLGHVLGMRNFKILPGESKVHPRLRTRRGCSFLKWPRILGVASGLPRLLCVGAIG